MSGTGLVKKISVQRLVTKNPEASAPLQNSAKLSAPLQSDCVLDEHRRPLKISGQPAHLSVAF